MALHDSCFYIYELWSTASLPPWLCSVLKELFAFAGLAIMNKVQSQYSFAVLLTVITAVSSLGFTLVYMSDIEWNEGMASTTARNKMDADKYQIILYFIFVMEILGVLCFVFIHNWSLWYRKRIRGFKSLKQRNQPTSIQSSQSLSVKFQIEESIRMTSLFLPIVLLRCSFSLYNFISASISNAIWPKPSIESQMVTFELTHITNMLPFFIVLLLAHGVGKLPKICCSSQRSVQEVTDTATNQTQDDYFKRLNQLFEAGDPKMAKPSPKSQLNTTKKYSKMFWTNRISDSLVSVA